MVRRVSNPRARSSASTRPITAATICTPESPTSHVASVSTRPNAPNSSADEAAYAGITSVEPAAYATTATPVTAAAVTGVAVVAYAAGSTLVMPAYAASSAEEFGAFGLVLTLATWLVGLSGVQIVAAVIGRVLAEDRALGLLTRRTMATLRDEAAKLRRQP